MHVRVIYGQNLQYILAKITTAVIKTRAVITRVGLSNKCLFIVEVFELVLGKLKVGLTIEDMVEN